MTDTVLSNTPSQSFADTIAAYGLPIIPRSLVRRHQWQLLRSNNPGIWILLHFWFASLELMMSIMKGFFADDDASSSDETLFLDLVVFIAYVLSTFLLAFVGGVSWMMGMNWVLLLLVPFAHMVISVIFFYTLPVKRVTNASSLWRYVTEDDYSLYNAMPKHIVVRADTLHKVSDTDIYVLEYCNDPFLVAVKRGWLPLWLRPKVVVGAWNTGTELDRM